MTDQSTKTLVVNRVKTLMESVPENPARACLFWAYATVLVLRELGIRAIIQAGSCSWPRIRMEDDDGVSATHFSYRFELMPALQRLMDGGLPEMHVWVAIPDRMEIIDLTTGFLPRNCEEIADITWLAEPPPEYLWCRLDYLPENWLYEPDVEAIRLTLNLIRQADSARVLTEAAARMSYTH